MDEDGLISHSKPARYVLSVYHIHCWKAKEDLPYLWRSHYFDAELAHPLLAAKKELLPLRLGFPDMMIMGYCVAL